MPSSKATHQTASANRGAHPLDGLRGARGKVLAVDDEPVNLRVLRRMLEVQGFTVLIASNGDEAVRLFESERPDLVFMDVMMPGMNGIETARRIKLSTAARLVPIIFLTALSDDETMLDCIAAGGDDFLTKPFSFKLLQARIMAAERVRDLSLSMASSSRPLTSLLEREHQEQQLAERVFSRAINSRNIDAPGLKLVQRAAKTFSGDLVLTQRLPDGGLRILLADITGHGLGATIGALPVAEIFHATTLKGVDDSALLGEINSKLHRVLPSDRFMAACLVTMSSNGRCVSWWNGGMPSAWLRTRSGIEELASHAVPLGVLPELPVSDSPRALQVDWGDAVLMFTDGVLSAQDRQDQTFGNARVQEHLRRWEHGQSVFDALVGDLDAHCGDATQPDDVAMAELVIAPAQMDSQPSDAPSSQGGRWSWSIELGDAQLAQMGAWPRLLKSINLLDGIERSGAALDTILPTLCRGALGQEWAGDPCLPLELDRACGRPLRLEIRYDGLHGGGVLTCSITDPAHPWTAAAQPPPTAERPDDARRVEELCESVTYDTEGRLIEAVYRWS